MVTITGPADRRARRSSGRSAAWLGIASALLLAAAFRWAHHWGPRTDAIVAAWALTTVGAVIVSIRSLRARRGNRRLAKLGAVLAAVSIVTFVAVGIAYAAGADPTGSCGGG